MINKNANADTRNNWTEDIKKIVADISYLLNAREIYHGYGKILNNNPVIQYPPNFHYIFQQNYAHAVSSGIRRHLGMRRDEISFRKLLESIKAEPWHLTKEWYSSLFDPDPGKGWGIAEFERDFGVGDYVDPKPIKDDIDKLDRLGKGIEDFTDTFVAHLGREKSINLPTFNEVDAFLTELHVMVPKYFRLLTTKGGYPFTPLQSDWTDIFLHPFITKPKN